MAARHSRWRVVTALVVIALMAIPIVGSVAKHPVEEPGPVIAGAGLGQTIPFDLYTHCGISELKAFGKYFERVGGPLGDGFGNPPKGWGNPYDSGTLSVAGNTAIFRDSRGHEVRFKLRPGQRASPRSVLETSLLSSSPPI